MTTTFFTKAPPRASLVLPLAIFAIHCDAPDPNPPANTTSASSSSSSSSSGPGGTGGAAGSGAGGSAGNGSGGGGGGAGGGPISNISFVGSPCPPRFITDIVACADGLVADPQFTSYVEAVIACSDAVPLADAYDASCAQDTPTPIYCGVDYSQVWTDLQDRCINEAMTAFAERTCVFGARYRDALDSKRLLVLSKQILDANSTLDNIQALQVVSAIEPSSHMAMTPADVFAVVDGGQVNRLELADRWNGRRYTVIEYGAGDNSYGRFFKAGTDMGLADIQDGDLYQCKADPGPGGENCDGYFSPSTCTSPLVCAGPAIQGTNGLCSLITPVANDGAPCSMDLDCGPDAYCTNIGICISPWKTGVFSDIAFAPLVDGAILSRTILVKGLATVPMNGVIDLVIHHPDTSQLTVTMTNPLGTEIPVFQGNPGGQDLVLEAVPILAPSDEPINGEWTLNIKDASGGNTAWLSHWRLFFTSRWD
jgi:Proprotein convertase P-domain